MIPAKMKFLSDLFLSHWCERNTSEYQATATTLKQRHKEDKCILRRKMSSIGRFSMKSQTFENPCNIAFFVALAHDRSDEFSVEDFRRLWSSRVMEKFERFRSRVCSDDDRYFEVLDEPMGHYVSSTSHPIATNENILKERIESMLSTQLDLKAKLWEVQLSCGDIGSSGAISIEKAKKRAVPLMEERETIALFRIHHALCDGVSASIVIAEASDEADRLSKWSESEIMKRRTQMMRVGKSVKSVFETICKWFLFYVVGSIHAITLLFWRIMVSSNPFDEIITKDGGLRHERGVAWRPVAPLIEMKHVAKSVSPSATLNDLTVSMVAYAIERQLQEHVDQDRINSCDFKRGFNIVIPVHLTGGVFRPGDQLGNKIGAFVTNIPTKSKRTTSSRQRLLTISKCLKEGRSSPAPFIAWNLAKFFSNYTPDWCSQYVMKKGNAKSVAVVSNVRGFPFQVHWLGHKIEQICAFLPLPSGIPIGVLVHSYDGEVSFSVHAEKRAVPDTERFIDLMIEEYKRIKMIENLDEKAHLE